MIRKTQGWTPKTMAATLGIHPNTIRMYERLGFIATPARRPNGYRVLTDVHLAQLRICRTIFGCPYANRAIRDAGTRLVQASAQCNLPACRQAAQAYGQAIREEIEKAEQTRVLLTAWLAQPPEAEGDESLFSRKEAAKRIGVTVETIRNWERNGLIAGAGVGSRGEQLYAAQSLDRMRVIYMLRRTGYSMQAILRCLTIRDAAPASGRNGVPETLRQQMLRALEMPEVPEEPLGLVIMGDRWLESLHGMAADAAELPALVEALAKAVRRMAADTDTSFDTELSPDK